MKLGNNAIGNRERWKCVRTYHHKHTGWYSLGGRCQGGRLCRSWSLARCPWCRPSCKTSWSPPWQRSKLTSDKLSMWALCGIHIWCYSVCVLLLVKRLSLSYILVKRLSLSYFLVEVAFSIGRLHLLVHRPPHYLSLKRIESNIHYQHYWNQQFWSNI